LPPSAVTAARDNMLIAQRIYTKTTLLLVDESEDFIHQEQNKTIWPFKELCSSLSIANSAFSVDTD